jgi:hypothetical protein
MTVAYATLLDASIDSATNKAKFSPNKRLLYN